MKLSGARWPVMFLAEWPCGSILALSHNLSAGLLLQQLCGTWWSLLISFQLFRYGIFVTALPSSRALRTFAAFVLFFLRFLGCDTRTGKGSRSQLCPFLGQHGVRWCIDTWALYLFVFSRWLGLWERTGWKCRGWHTSLCWHTKRRETFFTSL